MQVGGGGTCNMNVNMLTVCFKQLLQNKKVHKFFCRVFAAKGNKTIKDLNFEIQ